MSISHRRSASHANVAIAKLPLWIMIGLAFSAAPVATFAANRNCTLIVPNNPLTPQGLATPYQLVATNLADGPCNEINKEDSSAFVQAAIIDSLTGQISIYHPLVIDKGTLPAALPVVPQLPLLPVVALWFGYNGDSLTLQGASPGTLSNNDCHQGFGQFAYCNATAFFAVANFEILINKLKVPPLGVGHDGRLCPSVRSFAVVDQDQSDNLPTTYLITASGRFAQNTAANRAAFSNPPVLGNPSDNRLTDVFLDGALGCTPWTAPDLGDPGAHVPALPLNELQAAAYQTAPVALIPLGDPMAFNNLAKVNEYRMGAGQFPAFFAADASTTTYCANVRVIASEKLILDRPFFTAYASPSPSVGNSLFTFMASRLNDTYSILNCQVLLNLPSPVTLIKNVQGIVIDAMIQP